MCLLALLGMAAWAEPSSLRVAVIDEGPCRVAATSLAAGFSLSEADVQAALAAGEFSLTRAGQPVAWTPAPECDGLLFYGLPNRSVDSRETIYWLRHEAGLTLAQESHAGDGVDAASEPVGIFTDTARQESNLYSTIIRDSMPGADYLLWKFLNVNSSNSFSCPTPGYAGTGTPVRITVAIRSLHPEDEEDEHSFRITWDFTNELGNASWQGMQTMVWSASLPAEQALSQTGGVLTLYETKGVTAGRGVLQWIEVDYPRWCQASGNRLILPAGEATNLVIGGFTIEPVTVWDVTEPDSPVILTGLAATARDGAFAIGFSPPAPGRKYAAFTQAAAVPPASIRSGQVLPGLADATNAADWVVLIPPRDLADFQWGAERLAAFRTAQGLRTRIVMAEQVADTFGDGVCSTGAIRAFVQATAGWAARPRSLVLMGYGNVDYRLDSALTKCLLPTPAKPIVFGVGDRKGEFVSADPSYGDDDGDGVPDVVIGRLPVATSNELANALDNLERYEESGAWKSNALFTADNPTNAVSEGLNLHVSTDIAADNLQAGGYQTIRSYVPSSTLISRVIRTEVLAILTNRVSVYMHLGHGDAGMIGWGSVGNGILVNTLFGLSQNWDRPPIGLFPSCQINRFHNPVDPNTFCLQAWRQPGTGFTAIYAPSSMMFDVDAILFAQELMKAWAAPETIRLGDAITRAATAVKGRLVAAETLGCQTLLGDPATVIRFDRTAFGTGTDWLREYGLTEPNADVADLDGDSFPTWVEFLEGGNPLVKEDHPLRIKAFRTVSERMALEFVSGPGSRYRVLSSSGLSPTNTWEACSTALTETGPWREAGEPVLAEDIRTTVYVPLEGESRFFQVEAAP